MRHRLQQRLARRGSEAAAPAAAHGTQGRRAFAPLSWDDALAEIAERLKAIRDGAGPEAILHTHYTGTCSALANGFPSRFFARLGATEAIPDSICNDAGHAALGYVFGESHMGFDPRTAKDSACIVVWGANPSHSAPHAHKHWLRESPARVVVIDPVRHDTAREADLHLQLRPGSDAALAFGMCHIARRDGLLDLDAIRDRVLGYDAVEADIAAATPEWTAARTGLAAADIEEAARGLRRRPSLLWLGQGLQRQPAGGNVFRACAMLPALTGNIGRPGAGFHYLNDTGGIAARKGAAPAWRGANGGGGPAISQMDVPGALNDPDRFAAYMVWNCNPLASNPDQTRMRSGLAREDLFTVVVDCFPTDTADYADIVLPAASFLEFDDLNASYFHLIVGAQAKCAEPMGESLPNQEIFRRLAAAMGFEDPALHRDDASMLDGMLADMGLGLTFEELKAKGWVRASEEPLVLWSEGVFPTPSGRIEIASERAQADGHPLTPQPLADAPPQEGRLRLLSPAGRWLMNSSYGNDPRIRELMGAPAVAIHPEDARRLGVADGERVALANEAGRLAMTAVVSDIVPAGTLLADKEPLAARGRRRQRQYPPHSAQDGHGREHQRPRRGGDADARFRGPLGSPRRPASGGTVMFEREAAELERRSSIAPQDCACEAGRWRTEPAGAAGGTPAGPSDCAGEAAVDAEVLAGDVARPVGRQEGDGGGDLRYGAVALHGNAGLEVRVLRQAVDEAGQHIVHADSRSRVAVGEELAPCGKPGAEHARGGKDGIGLEGREGGDVHDRARALGLHRGQNRAGRAHRRQEVDLHAGMPVLVGEPP